MWTNNNTSKRILDELIEVDRVAVIKLRVNNGDGDGTSCFRIEIRTNRPTAKLTNVRITRFR